MEITLQEARQSVGLSVEDAAYRLKITAPTLIRYESGVTSPTIRTVMKMLEVYNRNIDEIRF